MSFITYIPEAGGGYTLTYSRVESIKTRLSSPPVRKRLDDIQTVYPVNPVNMGSWIGVADSGRTACLLQENYPLSSKPMHPQSDPGRIVPHLLNSFSMFEFIENTSLEGLSPFVLLIIENGKLYQSVFNGARFGTQELSFDSPHIFASNAVYTPEMKKNQKLDFLDWYFHSYSMPEQSIQFHKENGYEQLKSKQHIQESHLYRTVSIADIHRSNDILTMTYLDVVNNIPFVRSLKMKDWIPEVLAQG